MSDRLARNLLPGVLAFHLNLINQDQLVSGCRVWCVDKDRGLDKILLQHGALTNDTGALLQALISKHLDLHGADAKRSLSALSSIGQVQDALREIEDADLHEAISSTATDESQELDPWITKPFAGDESNSGGVTDGIGSRFTIVRPHAKGGLGQVSIARDRELGREVALKEIQGRYADDPNSRARFLREAEITGGLEHPGIVPVYALGAHADGRPYYAMRLIRGDSLEAAIQQFHAAGPAIQSSEHNLELRKLLRRFIDVCNAVAYAHSRGVLHRDLKPGNIMVGKYGETLVVDWGLAKPLGRATGGGQGDSPADPPLLPTSNVAPAATRMGAAVGTPAYMSPEQAAGQLDRLESTSDVYSLGATLYTLLTGRLPFSEPANLLVRIQNGDFPAPRQIAPWAPAALEAICLRAMHQAPSERYPTPRALAEDVENWLADEPVSAYAAPLLDRLSRWARRHRALVSSAAVLLITATLALATSTALIGRQKALTQQALNQVTETNTRLEQTLARSLLRPLGHNQGEFTEAEYDAAWEMAGSNDRIRLLVIHEALRDRTTIRQLRDRAALAMPAIVGLNPDLRRQIEELLMPRLQDDELPLAERVDIAVVGLHVGGGSLEFNTLATQIVLDALAEETADETLDSVASAVRLLAPRVPSDQTAQIVQAAQTAIGRTGNLSGATNLCAAVRDVAGHLTPSDASASVEIATDLLARALQTQTSLYLVGSSGEMMQALAERMEPNASAELLAPLLVGMNRTNNPTAHHYLTGGIVSVVNRLAPDEVPQAMQRTMDATEGSINSVAPDFFAKAFDALALRLDAAQAKPLVDAAQDQMQKASSRYAQDSLARAIAALAGRLDPQSADAAAHEAAGVLVEAMAETDDLYPLVSLAQGLRSLAPRLGQEHALIQLTAVVKKMRTTPHSDALLALGNCAGKLLDGLDRPAQPTQALAVLQALLDAQGEPQYVHDFKTTDNRALAALVNESQAALLVEKIGTLADSASSDTARNFFDDLLTAAAGRLPPPAARATFSKLLAGLADSPLTESRVRSLKALALAVSQHDAAEIADEVVAAIDSTKYAETASSLCEVMAELVRREPKSVKAAAEQATVVLTEACENATPGVLGELALGIARLAPTVDAAPTISTSVIEALDDADDLNTLPALARALVELAPHLSPAEAERAISACVGRMTPQDQSVLQSLATAVAALARRLGPEHAIARQMVFEAISKARLDFSARPLAGVALQVVGPLDQEEAFEATRLIIDATRTKFLSGVDTQNHFQSDLVSALILRLDQAELERRIGEVEKESHDAMPKSLAAGDPGRFPARFSEQQLARLLLMPTCTSATRKCLLDQLSQQCQSSFADVWAFVQWNRQHRPDSPIPLSADRPAL